MSIPICVCRPIALAKGDGTDAEFERFAQDMAYNARGMAWSTTPCRHTPLCKVPTKKQQDAFNAWLTARLAEINKPPPPLSPEEQAKKDAQVKKNFDNFSFPIIDSMRGAPILPDLLNIQPMTPTAETNRLAEKTWRMKPGTLRDPKKAS